MLTGQREAVVDAAGDGRDRQPGPALLGRGHQRGLVDHADRAAAAGHGDDRARPGPRGRGVPPRPAAGPRGRRGYGGPGCGPPGAAAGAGPWRPGGPRVAPFQRKKPMTKASRKSNTSGSTSKIACWRQRPEQDGDRGDPAAPGGDDGAAVHAAGQLPDRGLEHPAAVQRQPGHQVERADQQVPEGQPLDRPSAAGRRGPRTTARGRPGPPPARSAGRPRRSRTPAAGFLASASIARDAAEEVQGDRRRPGTRSAGPRSACEASCRSTER